MICPTFEPKHVVKGSFEGVVRNTLAKRAVEGTEYECAKPALVGPTTMAFLMTDPAQPQGC